MSSMDTGNTLRSQEFVQRSQLHSQSLQQDSANQMVSGVRQTLEAARQFAMLKAEADARLQMHEQEMAINRVKLQHMQALDATDLMGHQVEAARLQNEAAAFEIETAKKRAKSWETSGMDEVQSEITRMYGGGAGLLKQGLRWESGKLTKIPEGELKVLTAATRSQNQRAVDLRTLLRSYEDNFDEENAARIRAEIEAEVPGLLPPKPKPPSPAPAPALDQKAEAEIVPAMRAIAPVVTDPVKQKAVASLLWENRAAIAKVMNDARNKENMPAEFSEREAFDYTVRILANPNHPMFAQVKAYVQALWSRRFQNPQQATSLFDR